MANVVRQGYTSGDLTDLGFVDVPESPTGLWAFRSSAQGHTWSGYSESTIPLVYSYSASVQQSHGNRGWYDNTASVNGVAMASVHAYWDGDNYGSEYRITNYYGCIMGAYGMNLRTIQTSVKSGTPSVWLEAV